MAIHPGSSLFPGTSRFPGTSLTSRFEPPSVRRTVPIEGGLHMSLWYGLTVLRINGVWVETEWPTEQQLEAADLWFPGGTICTVDGDTADALAAAGYEVVEIEE